MRIGQRLLLAVMPGIIGVIAVASLAYWGERGRQVPGLLLAIVAIVTVASLWFAWVTTRDLARRIERLGRLVDAHQRRGTQDEPTLLVALARETVSRLSGSGRARADELDAVERLIARFDGELARVSEHERSAEERVAASQRETARLLHDASDRIAKRIDEVRMPLQVLLEAPFGQLNENQEELIGVARAAADEAGADAKRLRELGSLELVAGARRDRLPASEMLRALQPVVEAEARRGRVSVEFVIAPGLPALTGDRARLQETIHAVLSRVVRAMSPDTTLRVGAEVAAAGGVCLRITPVSGLTLDDVTLERRTLEALGASLEIAGGTAEVVLPVWR